MPIIEIEIKNKIARSPEAEIVCGNSDYEIHFSFDEEWSEYNVKTARFRYNGTKADVVFEGNVCNAPIIKGASFCTVGVFAGNLHTTTPAVIVCKRGALCDDGMPADPTPDVYAQIMELLNNITGMDDEVVARALADYLAKNPLKETDPTVPAWAKQPEKPKYTAQEVGALPSTTAIPTNPEDVNAAPKQMEVKIVNGVASHTPAQIFAHVQAGGEAITYGLIGAVHRLDTISETSAVFICNNINTTSVSKDYVVIAADGKVTIGQNHYKPTVPTTLPNPNALTFTGAVEGSYDGSKALSVEIPQGGGGAEWCEEVLEEGTLAKDVSVAYATSVTVAKLREYKTFAYILEGASNGTTTNLYLRVRKLPLEKNPYGHSIDRADANGRLVVFEWVDKGKTILRPVSGYYGNPSMIHANESLANGSNDARLLTPTAQASVIRYSDLSSANDADILYFSGPVPTVDLHFSIRGLTK